ncbi:MAG TPA: tRNA 2-thiocytidine biosynthesis protein TtcA, partial [Bacillota bacterium]|nr:tRNA 2-thiocytidine biosynthesis protein TtcA [Bacillota bacterium]
NCACMVAAGKIANKRYEIKALIKELKEKIENVDTNILRSTQNVNLEAILGWHKGGKQYSYLDFYEEQE